MYAQLTLEFLQQQLSEVVQQQLPGMFQEQGEEATTGEDQGLLFDPTEVLRRLSENLNRYTVMVDSDASRSRVDLPRLVHNATTGPQTSGVILRGF